MPAQRNSDGDYGMSGKIVAVVVIVVVVALHGERGVFIQQPCLNSEWESSQ